MMAETRMLVIGHKMCNANAMHIYSEVSSTEFFEACSLASVHIIAALIVLIPEVAEVI